jgi:hypothetical protein
MVIQGNATSQLSAPRIINDHRSSHLGDLYDGLRFAAVFHPSASAFGQKKVDGSFIVVVTPFQKCEFLKQELQPILRSPALEQILANGLRDQHTRK